MENKEKKNSFEERLAKLDQIATKIEGKALPLDEAIKLYEEGLAIVTSLEKELELAKEKVEKVITK